MHFEPVGGWILCIDIGGKLRWCVLSVRVPCWFFLPSSVNGRHLGLPHQFGQVGQITDANGRPINDVVDIQ